MSERICKACDGTGKRTEKYSNRVVRHGETCPVCNGFTKPLLGHLEMCEMLYQILDKLNRLEDDGK